MGIADPKKYAQTKVQDDEPETDTQDLQAQIAALQATVQALVAAKSTPDDDRLEKILLRVAQMSADAHERAANPSNKTHPGVSVFSYPEGDRAKPRPALKCEMFWIGYPVETNTNTAAEIELLNLAEPGTYRFQRTDKSWETLTVTGDLAPGGSTLTKLLFNFPVKERRDTLPSMEDMLRTAFGVKTAEQIELDALRAEVTRLKTHESVGV